MFDPASRYYDIETLIYQGADGRQIPYKARRFPPQGAALELLTIVRVGDHDRLDLVAARTLGDSLQYWRICDANDAMDPADLVNQPARMLRVPVPQQWPSGGGS